MVLENYFSGFCSSSNEYEWLLLVSSVEKVWLFANGSSLATMRVSFINYWLQFSVLFGFMDLLPHYGYKNSVMQGRVD